MQRAKGRVIDRGSGYFVIKESGLKDHDPYGFWGLSPRYFGSWALWVIDMAGEPLV